jgi:uncharacterized HAD superfamily protein
MPKYKKLCVFDVDGVVADTVTAAMTYAEENFGKYLPADWYGNTLTREEQQQMFTDREFYNSIDPYEGVVEVISDLYNIGFNITFLSGRPVAKGSVLYWLMEHDIPFDNIIRAKKKDKLEYVKVNSPWIFVEDNLSTAVAAGDYAMYSFLIRHPWSDCTNPKTVTIDELEEILFYAGGYDAK